MKSLEKYIAESLQVKTEHLDFGTEVMRCVKDQYIKWIEEIINDPDTKEALLHNAGEAWYRRYGGVDINLIDYDELNKMVAEFGQIVIDDINRLNTNRDAIEIIKKYPVEESWKLTIKCFMPAVEMGKRDKPKVNEWNTTIKNQCELPGKKCSLTIDDVLSYCMLQVAGTVTGTTVDFKYGSLHIGYRYTSGFGVDLEYQPK